MPVTHSLSPRVTRWLLPLVVLWSSVLAHASPFSNLAATHEGTINDLVRRVPSYSPRANRHLAELSAIQEQITVYERRMRGAGLPPTVATLANAHYTAVLDAMVSDRLSEELGRDALNLHRQLMELAYEWEAGQYSDEPNFEGALIDGFATILERVREEAIPMLAVPAEIRTPVVNGFQTWLIGLETWGGECRSLTHSDLVKIQNKARIFANFERVYKTDGRLTHYERKLLHERLFELQREVIEIIAR